MPQPAPDLDRTASGIDGPAFGAAALVLSNTAELSPYARALYVGVGGDVKATTIAGNTVEFRNVPSGSILPVSCKIVFATGHTGNAASAIVALY